VLDRLLADRELLGAICALRFPRLWRQLPFLLRPAVRFLLQRQLGPVDSVHELQMVIREYMNRMIERTTSGFSVSGLDALDPATPYLFVSNHRDIAMDPAFTNYALNAAGFHTVRIAIGDNLLTKPWVSDMMRLNKSFIVRRSARSPRELMSASRHLSSYIRYSLQVERAPVWIAQREGRAKDGLDRTEPAVIKMLGLARDKASEEFGDYIAGLHIVPVAIAYELDPCDALKARELWQRASTGSYAKAAQEDIASIATGITGHKGHVHVNFGQPLGAGLDSPAAVAAAIDAQIVRGYRLQPSNVLAYRELEGADAPVPGAVPEPASREAAAFAARMQAIPESHRAYALGMYANAVRSKLAIDGAGLAQ
jgi:hypothetical protein